MSKWLWGPKCSYFPQGKAGRMFSLIHPVPSLRTNGVLPPLHLQPSGKGHVYGYTERTTLAYICGNSATKHIQQNTA